MARLLRIEYPGACYYIRNRGKNGKQIFDSDDDYKAFIQRMSAFADNYRINIRAYSLIPKQFHIYLQTPEGNISRFMKALTTSYIAYKRKGRKHRSQLFQGRFYSLAIEDEIYGNIVSQYVHLASLGAAKLKKADLKGRKAFINK